MIAPFPKMGLCTNNSRTRIAFWGFSGIVKFVEMREIIYSPQTQFSRLPSLPVLPVIARSMCCEGNGAWSQFPCYCFHFLSVLTSADVMFWRQRSKGSRERTETMRPFVPSFIWAIRALCIFPKQTRKNWRPVTWWVSRAGGKRNEIKKTEPRLTQEILSLSCLVPISPQSCALPQFICQLFSTPCPHKLRSKCCGCHPSCCFQFARSFRLWGASC